MKLRPIKTIGSGKVYDLVKGGNHGKRNKQRANVRGGNAKR